MTVQRMLPRNISRLFLAVSFLFSVSASSALSQTNPECAKPCTERPETISCPPQCPDPSNDGSQPELADDSLILLLAPHTNVDQAKADLTRNLNVNVIADVHVSKDDYSILRLQPANGQRESTLNKIFEIKSQHPEYLTATKNEVIHGSYIRANNLSAVSSSASIPNDPDFPLQWPLSNMNWTRAWRQYRGLQRQPARITILGTCPDAITAPFDPNELGPNIHMYNTLQNGVPVPLPQPGSFEGNIDSSLTGCLTDNKTLIAGAACFSPSLPCQITIGQITPTTDAEGTTLFNVLTGVTWAIENQKLRGGPGPVSMSYNLHSAPCGAGAFQNNLVLQTLAGSLRRQGDILVESAGDCPCLNSTFLLGSPQNIVLIQGTDMSNKFDSDQLTRVLNDPYAAPGACLPSLLAEGGKTQIQYNIGSSNSAPLWSSAIAMVQAFNPSLNAVQANKLVLETGTPVVGAPWHAVIPNFYNAIHAALAH